MENKPGSKLGILIFCLVFIAIAAAIAATVLLANNHRHLNRVMRALGFPVNETMLIPKPGSMEKFKGKRLKGMTVMLDSHVLVPEVKDLESAFLRTMRKDGETLCDLFNRSGFPMSQWKPGSYSKKVSECYNELIIPNPEKPDEPSSFFFMIKGAPDGTLISTRVKFIFTDAAAREKLTDMAVKVLRIYAEATKWTEIAEESNKVMRLAPFTTSLGGVGARFSSEFSGNGRYNLIFSRSSQLSQAQKRTLFHFDREKFLALPPDVGGPPVVAAPAKT